MTVLVTHLPSFLMNLINHMSVFITGESKYEIIITVNITCMMVLASIYLGKGRVKKIKNSDIFHSGGGGSAGVNYH